MKDKRGRQAYRKKLDRQWAVGNVPLTLFKARTTKVKAELPSEYVKTCQALPVGPSKFQFLKTASQEAWGELKGIAENGWLEIKVAFQVAFSK